MPGLDLGEIEDVVDEGEQVAAGGEDVLEYSSCSFTSPTIRSSSTSEKPMTR